MLRKRSENSKPFFIQPESGVGSEHARVQNSEGLRQAPDREDQERHER